MAAGGYDGHFVTTVCDRDRCTLMLSSLPSFLKLRSPAHWMVLPIFRAVLLREIALELLSETNPEGFPLGHLLSPVKLAWMLYRPVHTNPCAMREHC